MADLIDKKKLLKAVLDEYAEGNFYVMNLIRDFPAEDAVAPVRCRNCRFFREQFISINGKIIPDHRCEEWARNTLESGFCHLAERKEE